AQPSRKSAIPITAITADSHSMRPTRSASIQAAKAVPKRTLVSRNAATGPVGAPRRSRSTPFVFEKTRRYDRDSEMSDFGQDEHNDRIQLQHLMGEFGFDRLTAEIYEAILTCGPLPEANSSPYSVSPRRASTAVSPCCRTTSSYPWTTSGSNRGT